MPWSSRIRYTDAPSALEMSVRNSSRPQMRLPHCLAPISLPFPTFPILPPFLPLKFLPIATPHQLARSPVGPIWGDNLAEMWTGGDAMLSRLHFRPSAPNRCCLPRHDPRDRLPSIHTSSPITSQIRDIRFLIATQTSQPKLGRLFPCKLAFSVGNQLPIPHTWWWGARSERPLPHAPGRRVLRFSDVTFARNGFQISNGADTLACSTPLRAIPPVRSTCEFPAPALWGPIRRPGRRGDSAGTPSAVLRGQEREGGERNRAIPG
jgi:hypothetical protein